MMVLNTQFSNKPIKDTERLTRSQRVSIAKFEVYKDKANGLEHLDFAKDPKTKTRKRGF